MRLLEKDRESRFQSAEELAQILEQCLAHVQKPATEPLPACCRAQSIFLIAGAASKLVPGRNGECVLVLAGVFYCP